jgi:transposase
VEMGLSDVHMVSRITPQCVFRQLFLCGRWLSVVIEENNPGINKWKSRDYKSILMDSRKNAEQRKKQKMKQRFFYARIAEDYLEAPGDAKQLRFKHCLDTYQSNNWSLEVEPGID